MNPLRKLLLLLIVILATSSSSFADCVGCYSFVKVKIELVGGNIMEGYVFDSIYDQEFIVDKSKHEYFNFLDDYIKIKDTKLDLEKISNVDVDIFYDESKVKKIKSTTIKKIKEKHRETYRINSINEFLYKIVRGMKPIAYYTIGDWLFISYNEKISKKEFENIFSDCITGDFDNCIAEKAMSLDKKVLVFNTFQGC